MTKEICPVLLLLIFSISCIHCFSQPAEKKSATGRPLPVRGHLVTVTRVVDGDTFWADDGSPKGMKIRLTGIDAPESRRSFRKEAGYFGAASKAYLTKLLQNRKVTLETDISPKDRYGRTLAYVYLSDGTFVNAEMVKQGYATIMTVPPNIKYAEVFARLQAEAREHKRGLWASGNGQW